MTLDPHTLVKSLKSFFHRTVLDLPQIFYVTQKLKTMRKRRVEITNRSQLCDGALHLLTSLSIATVRGTLASIPASLMS